MAASNQGPGGAITGVMLVLLVFDIAFIVQLAHALSGGKASTWAPIRSALRRVNVDRVYSGYDVLLRTKLDRLPFRAGAVCQRCDQAMVV